MLNVVDLVYYCHNDYDKPQQVIEKHAPSSGFADYIKDRINIQFVKHLNYEGTDIVNGVKYSFFKGNNRFWHIPFKSHRYIKKQKPDIVIVEGLVFPLQLMMLKFILGNKCRVIGQHHGEQPFKGVKGFFQKIADRSIDAYLFTSAGNAKKWIEAKIIRQPHKCREILESSTYFSRQGREECQDKLGIKGKYNFLWVGRLDSNKNPVTALKGFEKFAGNNPGARFYMIYQDATLLKEISVLINKSEALKKTVTLVGNVPNQELPCWYSSVNFYISASHRESSGYALMEAMACGCIPVVTDIPSFKKMTANGEFGFLYHAGDADALAEKLHKLINIDIDKYSTRVEKYFKENLHFKNIADDLYNICKEVVKNAG